MKKVSLSLFAFVASATAAISQGMDPGDKNVDCLLNMMDPACSTPVPEISALEGAAALAALAAVLLIAWERRRRAV